MTPALTRSSLYFCMSATRSLNPSGNWPFSLSSDAFTSTRTRISIPFRSGPLIRPSTYASNGPAAFRHSLLAAEGPGRAGQQDDGQAAHEGDLFSDRHRVTEHGHAQTGRGRLDPEDDLAYGVDTIGDRVDLREDLHPPRDRVDREEDAGKEDQWEDDDVDQHLEALLRAHPRRDEDAEP